MGDQIDFHEARDRVLPIPEGSHGNPALHGRNCSLGTLRSPPDGSTRRGQQAIKRRGARPEHALPHAAFEIQVPMPFQDRHQDRE